MKSGLLHTLQVVAVANSTQPLITSLGSISTAEPSLLGGQVLVLERVKLGLHVTQVQPPS